MFAFGAYDVLTRANDPFGATVLLSLGAALAMLFAGISSALPASGSGHNE